MSARLEGYIAAQNGMKRSDNPYASASLRFMAWFDGFTDFAGI